MLKVESVAGTYNKIEAIKPYLEEPYIRQLLKITMDKNIVYGIKTIPKVEQFVSDIEPNVDMKFMALLTDIATKKLFGLARRDAVHDLLSRNRIVNTAIIRIIKKNLMMGMNTQKLRMVCPILIDKFSPMKGASLNKKNFNVFKVGIAQAKMDGIRCVAIVNRKTRDVSCYSYNNKMFPEFSILFQGELLDFADKFFKQYEEIVFDGEVLNDNWNETIMSRNKIRKGEEVSNKYYIFSYIPGDDWNNCHTDLTNIETIKYIEECLKNFECERLTYPLTMYYDISDAKLDAEGRKKYFEQFFEDILNMGEGYEGIMFKDANATYAFKRDSSWLKYKPVETYDMYITDWFMASGKLEGMFGGFVCTGLTDDGDIINTKVGSGFTYEMRQWILDNIEGIIGQVIEVECKALSRNQNSDTYSLREPTFKRFRHDK